MRKNYEKAAFKSKPTSIRYNLAQFEIAKQLGGFGTVQQMFDVLLRDYVRNVGGVVRSEVEKLVNWAEASKDNIPMETPPPPEPKPMKMTKPAAATKNEPTPRGSYDRRKQKLGW